MPDVLTNRDSGDETPEEADRLLSWRFDELERAGYPLDVAAMLAAKRDVDLELARSLLERGASVHQALRILT